MYNVLLVEDEKVIRNGMVVLINEVAVGFKAMWEAGDGTRAWEILQHEMPDVLITDIRMPKMDGLHLIRKAKTLYPDMPVVIVSGYDDFEYARRAIKYGVQDYLLKPINRVEFVSTMEKVHARCEAQKEETDASDSQPHPALSETDSPIIQEIKTYVLHHMDAEISLQAAAEKVHVHPNYLSQLFKKETGKNFSQFIREIRLSRAKELLRETNLKIYEVARLSGYVSDKHFTRVFKSAEGKTPKEYRTEQKKG